MKRLVRGSVVLVRKLSILRAGVVVDSPVSYESDDECEDALQDEDPAPSATTANARHLSDAESQETTEGTGSSCSGEEQSHSETAFVASIPGVNCK